MPNRGGNGSSTDRVLAVDIGTSAVKAVLWSPYDGVLARGHASVPTSHPGPGYAEQDADDWWSAVRDAMSALPLDGVAAIGFSSQRETFVPLDDSGTPIRPALLWSDRRGATPRKRLGWLKEHEPDTVDRAVVLAAPRDYVVARMTGRLVTDTTMASRTDLNAKWLPPIEPPRSVVGTYDGIPVVVGAGDRACEALAVGATSDAPMVSWGTTANVSVPVEDGTPTPDGWVASIGVHGGPLLEAGMSAAGSALGWLSRVTGIRPEELTKAAADVSPGARGVVLLPWLNGARAPWWRPDVLGTITGLDLLARPAELARALYEGVAHDVRRAIGRLPTPPSELRLAGGGVHDDVWRDALGGITGLPLAHSDITDVAAIGAARLAAEAVGLRQPAFRASSALVRRPTPSLVAAYAELIAAHDTAASTAIGSAS